MKATLLAAAVMAAVSLTAGSLGSAQENQSPGVKETIKEDAKTAGHAVADASRKVGHEIADTSRKVGHEIADKTAPARETVKEDSKKAGKAVAHSAKAVGKSVKDGAEKAKDAVTKSDDSKSGK